MQANIALGLLETSSIAKGVEAVDVMCKAAGVEVVRSVGLPRGKFMIIISGPLGEIESSMRSGREIAGSTIISASIIKNVHKAVWEGIEKKCPASKLEAVGIIETKDALPALVAADAACKAAFVSLMEVRLVAGGGKGYFSINGEVGAVRTAIAAGVKEIGEEALVSRIVIPQAHAHLIKAV